MKLEQCIASILLCIGLNSFAQSKDTLDLEKQFDKIYRISTSYQEYKVIKKTRYQQLKKNTLDSVATLKREINDKNIMIQSKSDSIDEAQKVIELLNTDLKQTITEKNNISFLGINLLKSTYNILVWSMILLLVTLLGVFIFRFTNNNLVTKATKQELQTLEEEFSMHKKRSLEREQKLRRQLQDEINKQRGV